MRHPTSKNDLRVQKTLERIQKAFYKLVAKEDYSSLTVSALCSEAKIGRKTFYVYYESLDDLLQESVERIAKEYIERIKGLKKPDDMFEITKQFYLFSIEQGKFYDNLICSTGYQTIGGELLMRLVKDTWDSSPWFCSLPDDLREIILCFIYNSGSSLYKHWIISGRKIPLQKMIDIANTLLAKGIEGIK